MQTNSTIDEFCFAHSYNSIIRPSVNDLWLFSLYLTAKNFNLFLKLDEKAILYNMECVFAKKHYLKTNTILFSLLTRFRRDF